MFKEISVPDLYGDFNSSDSWYVHKFVEILFPLERITAYLKEYLESKENVHNMLESGLTYVLLSPGMFRKSIVKPFGLIEWVLKHSLV